MQYRRFLGESLISNWSSALFNYRMLSRWSKLGRWAYVKRYDDAISGKEFVIRVIVERTESGITVVTAHRSSRIRRYLKDLT